MGNRMMRLMKIIDPELDDKSLLNSDLIKVVIIGCIAIIIALLFMSITSVVITKNAVLNKLKTSDLKNMATSITAVIDGRIEKAVDASLLMANDPTVIKWVKSQDADVESGKIVQEKMDKLVTGFGYDTSFLCSNFTKNFWSFHGNTFELLDVVSELDPDDEWFFYSINMKKRYEINIDHNRELDDTFVWINAQVYDGNRPIAVTGVGMNLSDVIEELIQEESFNKVQNEIWLVDEQGIIYLSKHRDYLNQSWSNYLPVTLTEAINKPDNLESSFTVAEYEGKNGEVYDVAFKKIKDTGWKLVVQIPRSESLIFIKAITTNMVLSCIIIILIMVAIFYRLSNRIANPYKRALLLNEELEKKVDERTRELEEKNAEAERTQKELAESEKMAALGQLVAGIAHEINTPLGAINSSVSSISEAVPVALEQIPEVFLQLNDAGKQEFMNILDTALSANTVLSMREMRTLRKKLTAHLEDAGIPDAASFADSLVDLGIYDLSDSIPILLMHPQSKLIFAALNNISSLIDGVKNIQTATMKVRKIAFALKNFARFDNSGERIAFDIREGLETVLTLYYHQIKQGTEVVRDYDDVSPIPCYPDELNQVWTNLVNNALHAMDYKGTLTIAVKRPADSQELMVAVSDTGHGMSEEVKAKIFAPFFTTKRAGEGSGLGLDIVKKIIDKHQGRIEVESEVGRGTTFSIFLPVV